MDMLGIERQIRLVVERARNAGYVPQNKGGYHMEENTSKNNQINTTHNNKKGIKTKMLNSVSGTGKYVKNPSVTSSRKSHRKVRDNRVNIVRHKRSSANKKLNSTIHTQHRHEHLNRTFNINDTRGVYTEHPLFAEDVDCIGGGDDIQRSSLVWSTITTPLQKRESALVEGDQKELLKKEFVTQNATLLLIACLGALLLITVNLVGVLCCKGYFKRKAKTIPTCTYPRPRSWLCRPRHFVSTRHFSLDSQAATMIDQIRDRNISNDPILGKSYGNDRATSLSLGDMYRLKKSVHNPSSMKVTTTGIEMNEINPFDVKIEDLDPNPKDNNYKGSSFWEALRNFQMKIKTFNDKGEQTNSTGYFS